MLLIFFFAALSAQLILHEAGHLVCGLISGYRFSSFRVGSLMLFQEGKRLRFKTLSIAGTGGQCLMLPPQCDDTPIPFRLYLLGGVLRTQYAAALLHDHDAAKAAEILATLDRMAARYPYVSDIASERELLSAVRSKNNVN